ncbi:MAG: hypothetical protein EOP47_07790 [Sphingobacteriaceae bacterium]|nr:MAG: hypothetical protein EOP47_07790 [Sphingobacteriaceae bacterium]
MKVNFEIITSTEIGYDGRHLDLHNNFAVSRFDYNIVERKLSIHLIKSQGDWVKEDELENIAFIHRNVSFLNSNFTNLTKFIDDDSCLEFISYLPIKDRDITDGFLNKSFPDEKDDIIYSFVNGQFIKINCEEVDLITF